jgi:ArsR family transcriptional regulator, lead/cadmium/zinc/bismuth-responsive transcriptional repressor
VEETLNGRVPGRPGRRKGSGKRAGAEGAWGQRAVQALADPSRWRIVIELAQAPRPLGELASRVGLSAACTSHHISILKEAELVETHREARSTVCSIPPAKSRAGELLHLVSEAQTQAAYVSNQMNSTPIGSRRPRTGAPELETTPRRDIEDFLL